MKKVLNFSLILIILLGSTPLLAQSDVKLGHVNTNELLRMMPERQEAQEELQRYAQDLEETFMSMQNEFQTKYQEFIDNQETYSQLVRQSKERELQSLQERIMEFEESAQQDIMQEEERLLRPIINEAREAIEEVARDNGFTYIFDTSGGAVVYHERGEDIMPLVMDKLNLDRDDMLPEDPALSEPDLDFDQPGRN